MILLHNTWLNQAEARIQPSVWVHGPVHATLPPPLAVSWIRSTAIFSTLFFEKKNAKFIFWNHNFEFCILKVWTLGILLFQNSNIHDYSI